MTDEELRKLQQKWDSRSMAGGLASKRPDYEIEIRSLIDALVDTKAERDAARADYHREVDSRAEIWADARAAAIEEAKRAITLAFEADEDVAALDVLEALAPLPLTLVVVERETIEKVKAALMAAARSYSWDSWDEIDEPVRAALALLEKAR